MRWGCQWGCRDLLRTRCRVPRERSGRRGILRRWSVRSRWSWRWPGLRRGDMLEPSLRSLRGLLLQTNLSWTNDEDGSSFLNCLCLRTRPTENWRIKEIKICNILYEKGHLRLKFFFKIVNIFASKFLFCFNILYRVIKSLKSFKSYYF